MPYPSKRVWIVGCIALAACVGLAAAGVSYSSRTEFCLSCHEMRVYQDELMLSPHAKDAQGKAIGCPPLQGHGFKGLFGCLLLALHSLFFRLLVDTWVNVLRQ